MKQFAGVLLAASLAAAAPGTDHLIDKRQQAGSYTSSQLEQGGCKGATFIWCRGTMEPGNMGWIIGNYLTPVLHKGLNNDIAVQGVKYSAGILTNIGPGMADSDGIKDATRLFKLAISKCPNTVVTGGGYSQGAAIMHRTIEKLDEDTKSKITAILLYGDTQYPFDGASIKGFPKDKVKTICKSDDGVCVGGITVTPGHLSYSGKAAEGANWIVERVKSAKKEGKSGGKGKSGGGGGEESSSEGGESAPAEEEKPAPAPKAKGKAPTTGSKGAPKGGKGAKSAKSNTVHEEFFENL